MNAPEKSTPVSFCCGTIFLLLNVIMLNIITYVMNSFLTNSIMQLLYYYFLMLLWLILLLMRRV